MVSVHWNPLHVSHKLVMSSNVRSLPFQKLSQQALTWPGVKSTTSTVYAMGNHLCHAQRSFPFFSWLQSDEQVMLNKPVSGLEQESADWTHQKPGVSSRLLRTNHIALGLGTFRPASNYG